MNAQDLRLQAPGLLRLRKRTGERMLPIRECPFKRFGEFVKMGGSDEFAETMEYIGGIYAAAELFHGVRPFRPADLKKFPISS